MLAGRAVGTAALAELQFPELEVLLELASLLLGRFAVLGRWPECPPVVEERPVGADELFIEDRAMYAWVVLMFW